MTDSSALDGADVRAVVRLIAEVSRLDGDHIAQKSCLMGHLAELIAADSWAWGMSCQMAPDKPSVHLSLVHGGFTEQTYAMFSLAYHHPGMSVFHEPFARELNERKSHLTRRIAQFTDMDLYKKSACYPCWQKAEVEDVIMSLRPVDDGLFSIIGLYRNALSPTFDARDTRIAHLVLSGVPWLHSEGWPNHHTAAVRKLAPRQRMTLDLLIQGYTRQEIAAMLEISRHTANEYIKGVFQFFGVHSQPALIARFRHGDGGDV